MTASGVLISCATPAASRPMELSLSACASCVSSGDALGDVVDQDDAADGDEIAREQGSNGDVGGALFAGAGGEAELVEVVDARLVAEAFDARRRTRRGRHRASVWPMASARLTAYMASICAFQLSMRSSRSRARMPTLMDSTMFSLNSLRRSNSLILSSSRA